MVLSNPELEAVVLEASICEDDRNKTATGVGKINKKPVSPYKTYRPLALPKLIRPI